MDLSDDICDSVSDIDLSLKEIPQRYNKVSNLLEKAELVLSNNPTCSKDELNKVYKIVMEIEDNLETFIDVIHHITIHMRKHANDQMSHKQFARVQYLPGSLVTIKRDERDDELILANVVSFNPNTCEYTTEDISEDEYMDEYESIRINSSEGRRGVSDREVYIVSHDKIRQLPENDLMALKTREFSLNQKVWALFPMTTCLYKAKVVGVPSRKRGIYEYTVLFENDEVDGVVPLRTVPARYVICDENCDKPLK